MESSVIMEFPVVAELGHNACPQLSEMLTQLSIGFVEVLCSSIDGADIAIICKLTLSSMRAIVDNLEHTLFKILHHVGVHPHIIE